MISQWSLFQLHLRKSIRSEITSQHFSLICSEKKIMRGMKRWWWWCCCFPCAQTNKLICDTVRITNNRNLLRQRLSGTEVRNKETPGSNAAVSDYSAASCECGSSVLSFWTDKNRRSEETEGEKCRQWEERGALDESLMLMPAGWKMIILLSACDGVCVEVWQQPAAPLINKEEKPSVCVQQSSNCNVVN